MMMFDLNSLRKIESLWKTGSFRPPEKNVLRTAQAGMVPRLLEHPRCGVGSRGRGPVEGGWSPKALVPPPRPRRCLQPGFCCPGPAAPSQPQAAREAP